ncbi:MAG: class I SAM-dependent methyltransferase [Acidobacteriota bacterium]
MTRTTLTREQARRFYDRTGTRQDTQLVYERPALDRLVRQAAFGEATAVVELGCGTGHFARTLLTEHLPRRATYRGFDLSPEMVRIARERVEGFGPRAAVERIEGDPPLPLEDGCCDRFVSNYVLDLLPEGEIGAWLAEAHRLLRPGGRLCLVGITPGPTPLSRMIMALWSRVHRWRPSLVGGCRPLALRPHLDAAPGCWDLLHQSRIAAWGIASEVLVARRL